MICSVSALISRSSIYPIFSKLKNIEKIPSSHASNRLCGGIQKFLIQLTALFLPLTLATLCYSAELTLAWKPNKEADLAGYRIYYGSRSGAYSYSVDLGKSTSCTISKLVEGTTYFFVATAFNTDGMESDYSPELSHTIGSEVNPVSDTNPVTMVVDNDDNGTSHTGTWEVSSGQNPYGNNSLYSKKGTYSFEAEADSTYDVSIWWTSNRYRCTSVPVKIYDGQNIIDTVEVNQRRNGGRWNFLGTYDFSGTAKVVIVADNCNTSADAVEFVP